VTAKKHILLENKKIFGNLEISDDLGCMNWHEAVEVCKKLGKGWRLPTKDELNFLYENKEEIGGFGGFANNGYWSSTELDYFIAWRQNFFTGLQLSYIKLNTNSVRAVRAS
jgi:hypothetical protein